MAFITYPLNNIDYTAEDAELFHCTRTSGIWAEDSFSISVTGADNNVTVGTGIAWINNEEFSGKVTAMKSAEVLDLGIADSTYPRIDVIAIQFNANNNATDIIVKKGTPATNPVRPTIVRTGAIYELYLASIYRPAGATAITASNVTDLRMDKTVCGLMADSVTKVDMEAIRAQLMGLVGELEGAIQNIVVGEIVPIEKGGTNASTAADARQNLGITSENLGIKDYIVETGTSGDWTYKKWRSGEVECWWHGNLGTITLLTAVGSDIVSNGFRFAFPFEFAEVPACMVCYEGNDKGYAEMQAVGASSGKATTAQSAMYRLVRIGSASISLTNNMFSVYVKGKVS